jgi:alpha-D-ribose 1-methylphosphonate 5-triphosphate diphosphatase
VLSLGEAWALVSRNAALAAKLPDRGEIAPGRRADLVLVDAQEPQVVATIAAGRIAFMNAGARERVRAEALAAVV